MSRRRKRAVRREIVGLYSELLRCPDCDSDAELVEREPLMFVLTILHDPTCPTLRRQASR